MCSGLLGILGKNNFICSFLLSGHLDLFSFSLDAYLIFVSSVDSVRLCLQYLPFPRRLQQQVNEFVHLPHPSDSGPFITLVHVSENTQRWCQ